MAPCPDPSVLEGLFEGTLAPAQRAELERHLDSCEACAQTVSELARLFGSASWGPGGAALGTAGTLPTREDSLGGPVWAAPTVQDPRSGPPGPIGSAATLRDRDARDPGVTAPGARRGPPSVDLGRYRLGPQLGAGGMGMVFEAHDPELDRRVAVKLLHPGLSANAEQTRGRLVQEARAMARLAHPNVVAVYDVGRAGEQVFLAMELVEGSTLTRWLATPPQRTTEAILKVFIEAGRGLEAAHGVGLVHRDFKPDNVLVGTEGRARVTDFGLAMPVVHDQGAAHTGVTQDLRGSMTIQTERGAIVGTPAYMAPEQWQGLPADARSDQFSFCVDRRPRRGRARDRAGREPRLCAAAGRGPARARSHRVRRVLARDRAHLARGCGRDRRRRRARGGHG